ncbi:MAG: hypothetical protein FJY07_02280 [Bacteroidetes bacterium]|nr:hypothetical protein [Bacteroidota bacterium]
MNTDTLNITVVQGNWEDVTPSSGIPVLWDVHFPDQNTGYAVGVSGVIIKSTDGGLTWQSQSSGTAEELKTVMFANSNFGFAAGNNGTVIKTTDGGSTWVLKSPGNADMTDIFVLDQSNIYACNGTSSNGNLYYSADAGDTWTSLGNFIGRALWFNSVASGMILHGFFDSNISTTSDSGLTWQQVFTTSDQLEGLSFLDSQNGYTVGTGGIIYATGNGGSSWNSVSSGVSENLHAVSIKNLLAIAVGDLGKAVINSGSGWQVEVTGVAGIGALHGISVLNGQNAVAVGYTGSSGKIIRRK